MNEQRLGLEGPSGTIPRLEIKTLADSAKAYAEIEKLVYLVRSKRDTRDFTVGIDKDTYQWNSGDTSLVYYDFYNKYVDRSYLVLQLPFPDGEQEVKISLDNVSSVNGFTEKQAIIRRRTIHGNTTYTDYSTVYGKMDTYGKYLFDPNTATSFYTQHEGQIESKTATATSIIDPDAIFAIIKDKFPQLAE